MDECKSKRKFCCRHFLSVLLTAVIWLQAQGLHAGQVRRYKWSVNYQFWPPAADHPVDPHKEIIAINGQSPGPAIRARVGDTILVQLTNLMTTENIVIHWHGIRQIGTPWYDGSASVSQCAIDPGETFIYQFVVDKAGTYFYHGHHGLQRTAGLYGSLIVDLPEGLVEPFQYDGELCILLGDWWQKSIHEQETGLISKPFHWVGEPQALLIQGCDHEYTCSPMPQSPPNSGHNTISNLTTPAQCAPYVLQVQQGKMYRLRIANVASFLGFNFRIEGHNMTVVEADGNFVEPVELDNLNTYAGETYSVLVTANQDPSRNYWAATYRSPSSQNGLAILNYSPNPGNLLPTFPVPVSPSWNQTAYGMAQSKLFVARRGYDVPVPNKAHRQIILLATQNFVDGFKRWSVNNVSLSLPATPYLAAMKYHIRRAYSKIPPPDSYAQGYNITIPPPNPNATLGSGVYVLKFNSIIDVILQNANTLKEKVSETHPWHLHGHDFWVLGYGEGVFDAGKDAQSWNLQNPPLRNTVPLYSYGWTAIRFRADNPGVWSLHCHIEPHLSLGMAVIFAEGVARVGEVPRATMGCGLTKFLSLQQ